MRFYFILARRNPPQPSQIVLDVTGILTARGHHVNCGIPEETLTDYEAVAASHDLVLLKSYTPLALSLAGALHEHGATLCNPYPGCIAARNKIIAAQVLRQHGIQAPRYWVTGDLRLLREVAEQTPLVIKPYMGWRGEGVRLVRNARELLALPQPHSPVLVQEFIEGPGEDLRLYVAGDEVFAVRKPFGEGSFAVPGHPVALSAEMRRLALRCGIAFGLHLYGLDVIESPAGPFVVDVNYFPGYKGVPQAAEAVADHIASYDAPVSSLTVAISQEARP